MDDGKLKHLEFIQSVITRMNTNSFQIKGWTIALVSALIAVAASTENSLMLLTAVFPPLIFWFLDAYYLNQERRFGGLYDDVAEVSKNPKEIKPFAMWQNLYNEGCYSYQSAFWSLTLWRMYLVIIIIVSGTFIFIEYILS